MRLQDNDQRRGLPRFLSAMTAAGALAGFLALGVPSLHARAACPTPNGGGDAIGSLPFQNLNPESLGGGLVPSIVLEGPTLDAIRNVVVDATGEGYAELFDNGAEGVRVELQGRVTLIVDRNLLHDSGVTFGLDVTQNFQCGIAVITQFNHPLRTVNLPAAGDFGIPLEMLSNSGALDTGGLAVHSFNPAKKHHVLDLSGSGGTLRLDSHQ